MSTARKTLLITAVALLLIGAAVFTIALASAGFDFSKLGSRKMVTNTYDFDEVVREVRIDTSTADIVFEPAADGKCRVVCFEEEKLRHSVSVKDGTLTIEDHDSRKWYEHINLFSFNFKGPKLTVYLPAGSYASMNIHSSTGGVSVPKDFAFDSVTIELSTGGVSFCAAVGNRLEIKASTGSVAVENAAVGEMKLETNTGSIRVSGVKCSGAVSAEVSTGEVLFTNVECGSLTVSSNTGGIALTRTVAAGAMNLEADTGDIRFDGCDAAEIFAGTDTGDITGSFLTEKVIFAESDTGKVNVPRSTSGGRCELKTDTGDIDINIG